MPLSSRSIPGATPFSWRDIHDPMGMGREPFPHAVGRGSTQFAALRSAEESQGRRVHARFFVSASAEWRERATAPLYEPSRRPVAGISYTEVVPAAFDFAAAPVYLRRPIKKENVVFAIVEQPVETFIRGKRETPNIARKRGAIVKGPLGERYAPPNFWGLYEDDPDDPWQYRPKPGVRIRAIELHTPATFVAPWGERQYCESCYFVQSVGDPADMRLIDKEAFDLTWYPAPPA